MQHISLPRSCTIDSWKPEHLIAMKSIGNLNAECYWCYNVPIGLEKPESGDPMQLKSQWIRSKYDAKEFLKRAGGEAANQPRNPGVGAYETQGWLLKEGGGSGKWQRRWFILKVQPAPP